MNSGQLKEKNILAQMYRCSEAAALCALPSSQSRRNNVIRHRLNGNRKSVLRISSTNGTLKLRFGTKTTDSRVLDSEMRKRNAISVFIAIFIVISRFFLRTGSDARRISKSNGTGESNSRRNSTNSTVRRSDLNRNDRSARNEKGFARRPERRTRVGESRPLRKQTSPFKICDGSGRQKT